VGRVRSATGPAERTDKADGTDEKVTGRQGPRTWMRAATTASGTSTSSPSPPARSRPS